MASAVVLKTCCIPPRPLLLLLPLHSPPRWRYISLATVCPNIPPAGKSSKAVAFDLGTSFANLYGAFNLGLKPSDPC